MKTKYSRFAFIAKIILFVHIQLFLVFQSSAVDAFTQDTHSALPTPLLVSPGTTVTGTKDVVSKTLANHNRLVLDPKMDGLTTAAQPPAPIQSDPDPTPQVNLSPLAPNPKKKLTFSPDNAPIAAASSSLFKSTTHEEPSGSGQDNISDKLDPTTKEPLFAANVDTMPRANDPDKLAETALGPDGDIQARDSDPGDVTEKITTKEGKSTGKEGKSTGSRGDDSSTDEDCDPEVMNEFYEQRDRTSRGGSVDKEKERTVFDVAYKAGWIPKLNTRMHPPLIDPSVVTCELHQEIGWPKDISNLLRKNTAGYPYYASHVTRYWKKGKQFFLVHTVIYRPHYLTRQLFSIVITRPPREPS